MRVGAVGTWRLAWALMCSYRFMSTEGMSASGRQFPGTPVHKFLRSVGFYLTTRDPSTVQPELDQLSFLDHALPFVVWGIVVSFGLAI